jgi:uncharacterized Fe-S radical SAM superfamily protein PflX
VQVGDLVFSSDGLAKRGLLLRHLVMPGLLEEGKAILDWVGAAEGHLAVPASTRQSVLMSGSEQ